MDDEFELIEDSFLERLTATEDDVGRHRLAIMRRVNRAHLNTARDAELQKQLKFLIEGAAVSDGVLCGEGRILFVIGEGRVGKTEAIRHAVAARPEFKADGAYLPFVRFIAPSPCGHKQLGREFLHALGYELENEPTDHFIWERVRRQVKALRVRIVWVDEMHHAMRGTDVQKLRDTIKRTMQMDGWPVSFILSGIPLLADFMKGDAQILGRKRVVTFNLLDPTRNASSVRRSMTKIIRDHAGMGVPEDLGSDEFANRLCHAACRRFGLVVILTRAAVEQALDDPTAAGTVGIGHFAAAYEALTGCSKSQNVFTAKDWHLIRPEDALLLAPADDMPEAPSPSRKKRSAT